MHTSELQVVLNRCMYHSYAEFLSLFRGIYISKCIWFSFVLLSSTKNIYIAGNSPERVGRGTLAFKCLGQKVPHTPLLRGCLLS